MRLLIHQQNRKLLQIDLQQGGVAHVACREQGRRFRAEKGRDFRFQLQIERMVAVVTRDPAGFRP